LLPFVIHSDSITHIFNCCTLRNVSDVNIFPLEILKDESGKFVKINNQRIGLNKLTEVDDSVRLWNFGKLKITFTENDVVGKLKKKWNKTPKSVYWILLNRIMNLQRTLPPSPSLPPLVSVSQCFRTISPTHFWYYLWGYPIKISRLTQDRQQNPTIQNPDKTLYRQFCDVCSNKIICCNM
jgi:hypothetical protein